MPETARRVGRRLSTQIAEDELFIPEQNILLGAALSGQLLEEFSGVEALAIGAYNAGGHRIRRWLRDRGAGDLDRFVEAIPIGQTRDYIRRVSSHQARYRALGARSGEWPTLPPLRVGPELIQGADEDD
jgi:soluble lytic murein transglycosylase